MIISCTIDRTPEKPKYDFSEAGIDIDSVPDGHKLEELQSYAKDVKFILHTVNDMETTAVLSKMQPPDIDGFEKPTSLDAIPFKIVLGMFSGYRVAQVKTKMGIECEMELKKALTRLPSVRAVIAVGVAYGGDREKYKFGDVLVSKHIHGVKNMRLQPGEIINRPSDISTVQVADYLSDIFTALPLTWNKKFQCNKITDSDREPRYAKVHCGSIISAPMLVADEKSRDALLRNIPGGAIGGEMEGSVLLDIQNEHNADRARRHDLGVIIIKGVGDFGDDQKQEGKKWQYTASLAAVSYTEHKLVKTGGKLFKTEPENPED
jgi:nucleoside phosphorylase